MLENLLGALGRLEPVHRSTTPEELHAVARLRYQIYVEECGNRGLPGEDHESRTLRSEADSAPGTVVFRTGPADEPTGSVRARCYRAGTAPQSVRDTYAFDRFPELDQHAVVAIGFLVTRSTVRGRGAALAMLCEAMDTAIREYGAQFTVAICSPGLLRSYAKLGLKPFGASPVSTVRGLQIPLLGVLGDTRMTKRIGSPVYPVLRQCERDGLLPAEARDALNAVLQSVDATVQTDYQAISDELDGSRPTGSFVDLLPESARERITRSCGVDVPAGMHIVEQGAVDRDMFVVLSGAFEVLVEDRCVRILGPGDVLGEVAFFGTAGERSATVRAAGPSRVLLLRHGWMRRLRDKAPADAFAIYEAIGAIMADKIAQQR